MKNAKEFKKAGLIAKKSENLSKNFENLNEILNKFGVEILLEKATAKALSKKGFCLKKIFEKSDFLISLGGDGTLISLCRQSFGYDLPVLGIHAGRLGFLTDINLDEISPFFEEFFKGNYEIEEPFMLDVKIIKKNGKILEKVAFNDAVFVRKNAASIVKIDAFLNEKCFNSYFGDGLIVSTPVGSTGYNMSAGGSIIYPLSDVFILSPICSHSLTQRSVVLPKNFKVTLKSDDEILLVIDGQDCFEMSEISKVIVGISTKKAKLIRHLKRDYFQILKEKLKWGHI